MPSEPSRDRASIRLVDWDAGTAASSEQYLFVAAHTPLPWSDIVEVEAGALAYRFPIRKPTVLGVWRTAEATGFASMGGDAGAMGFNYLEFSMLDASSKRMGDPHRG